MSLLENEANFQLCSCSFSVEFDPRPSATGEHVGQRVEHDAHEAMKC
jgi:hypothetical protein